MDCFSSVQETGLLVKPCLLRGRSHPPRLFPALGEWSTVRMDSSTSYLLPYPTMKPFFRFTVTGTVQGVGFRPFIYTACVQAGLLGYVQNIGSGVIVVVNNAAALKRILAATPPPIRIDHTDIQKTNERCTNFRIRSSHGSGFAEIPPDLFLCDECLGELSDPHDRRHGYFFLTCTRCGPRFTIALSSPYDRDTTTMNDFAMCDRCREEYENPQSRRFHAQTIACHDCGPRLTLFENGRALTELNDTAIFKRIVIALKRNEIVAIKGVGGFHLISATTQEAITSINHLTGRSDKPYAVLCRDIAMARTIATLTPQEEELLTSAARPIILAKKNITTPPASELDTVGIMLAYTALHILLFEHYRKPLICTSSNVHDAPITTTQSEQFVPLVLDHDREIHNAADDSVIKVISEIPLFIRRSRGFVPQSIAIDTPNTTPLLALGAEMNNTFALYDGHGRVILSPHIGNTSHPETFERYRQSIDRFLDYTHIVPQAILCDAHPTYRTSLYGKELAENLSLPLIPIQHHRAHASAVATEHGLKDFVAIVCDGLGWGDDGTIWGGEIFENSTRIGHLETHPQLGGDSAARSPHKMLYGILRSFLTPTEIKPFMLNRFSHDECDILEKQFTEKFNTPLTSSCGRVLDAVAALLGLCSERTYDGRPAMLLEAHSSTPVAITPIIDGSILRTIPLFEYLVQNVHEDKSRLAATAQHYLAEGLYTIAAKKNKPIVWAGGCAYNRIMTEFLLEHGVLVNREVPPGDGGISFGQIAAYLANPRHERPRRH